MSIGRWVVFTFVAAIAGLETAGCAPPPGLTAAPPGVNIRETMMPKEDPAEALGEALTVETAKAKKKNALPNLVAAPPTALGETKTTTSGVVYETIKEGAGKPAEAGDRISVHYVGKLDNGKQFDSSRDRKQPASFMIGTGNVIKGWDEAVPGMLPGEVRKLTIPPNAGYGALGQGSSVPPNATLHFEIELIKVE